MRSRCGQNALLFITSSPRMLFSACKTFMQCSINGLFISYGVSLWLKWTLHFTLSLDICYLRVYLHIGGTVVEVIWSNSTNVSQIWGLFAVVGWGRVGRGEEHGGRRLPSSYETTRYTFCFWSSLYERKPFSQSDCSRWIGAGPF